MKIKLSDTNKKGTPHEVPFLENKKLFNNGYSSVFKPETVFELAAIIGFPDSSINIDSISSPDVDTHRHVNSIVFAVPAFLRTAFIVE